MRRHKLTWLAPVWVFAAWGGACSPASERQPRERPAATALDDIAQPNAGMPHEEHARVLEMAAPEPSPEPLGASAQQGQQGKVRYPISALQSPLTASVVSRLQAVLASSGNWRNTFIKVGDSHSTSPSFLECFSGKDFRLGDHDDLEPARAFFHGWSRESLAAKVGWHAVQTLGAPIRDEVSAMHPGFAIVMLGTNDTRQTPSDKFEHYLSQNVDSLLSLGVIPIVTTIPPRADGDDVANLVPEVNTIIRAVAQSRQVPLVDLNAALAPLGGLGLAHDGIHMTAFTDNGQHGCWLDADSLSAGQNARNLLTLTALERMRRFVIGGERPEEAPPALVGAGTLASPLHVDALPFADDGTTTGLASTIGGYPCSDRTLDGGEVVYSIELPVETRLRIRVLADATADLDLHWLEGEGADTCAMHADRALEITAPAGLHRIVLDGPAAKAGAYRLTIVPVDI